MVLMYTLSYVYLKYQQNLRKMKNGLIVTVMMIGPVVEDQEVYLRYVC